MLLHPHLSGVGGEDADDPQHGHGGRAQQDPAVERGFFLFLQLLLYLESLLQRDVVPLSEQALGGLLELGDAGVRQVVRVGEDVGAGQSLASWQDVESGSG